MKLLAEGRASEILDLGDGRVLRRFKRGGDPAFEALLLRPRQVDSVRTVAAAPAGGIVVRRDHQTFSNVPRRSSCS